MFFYRFEVFGAFQDLGFFVVPLENEGCKDCRLRLNLVKFSVVQDVQNEDVHLFVGSISLSK